MLHDLRAGRPEFRAHTCLSVIGGQLAAAIYGSFFGAGLGVLTLALLGVYLRDGLQHQNALKGVLSLIVNLVAAVCFAVAAPVVWGDAAVMLPGALAGGIAGVLAARRLSATVLRLVVIALGAAVAVRLLV